MVYKNIIRKSIEKAIIIIVLLLFTSCVKKTSNENNILKTNEIDIIQNNNAEAEVEAEADGNLEFNIKDMYHIQNFNIDIDVNNHDNFEQLINMPIQQIWNYILENNNLKENYNNIEELLLALNLHDGYNLTESIWEDAYSGGGTVDIYTIEWNQHKLIIYNIRGGPPKYFIGDFTIEINENNYLNIFPYNNIDEYYNDKNFGMLYSIKDNRVSYYINKMYKDSYGNVGFCHLYFENGILKYFQYVTFWT